MYYLAVTAIVRDERRYIEEWLDFHAGVGVEHFFLYDNGSIDGTFEFLSSCDPQRVTVAPWPGIARQLPAYEHCLAEYKDRARWIAFVDVDEFIVAPGGLRELLEEYEVHPALCAHWYVFGSSGHRQYEQRPVIERFTKREAAVNPHLKSIVDPRRTVRCPSPHQFVHEGFAVDEQWRPLEQLIGRSEGGTCDRIQINHYATKSYEECIERRRQPRADNAKLRDQGEFFSHHDRNDAEDFKALTIWNSLRGS